ncbi:MAG TPA: hypothetical protein PLA54_04455 [Spirochaetota bacterium]|nr:hypothetical protein [Spirochaetota bacterium]HQE58430.1 hypothetical protein [Spirochaetota bacterium]
MKNIILGLLAGTILAAIPMIRFDEPEIILPEWEGSFNPSLKIQASPYIKDGNASFSVKTPSEVFSLKTSGISSSSPVPEGYIASTSGNGQYFALYQKIGESVDFYDITSARFWQKKSEQYPLISYNGKIVLLLVADHSEVKILDKNGNQLENRIAGRFCTNISFSKETDYAVIGFLDGSYYLIDENGKTIHYGKTVDNLPVKTASVNINGSFIAVHFGNEKKDYIKVIDVKQSKEFISQLPNVSVTKTAVDINNDGNSVIISGDQILFFSKKCKTVAAYKIPEIRIGHSSALMTGDFAVLSCMNNTGSTVFMFSLENGLLYNRNFPDKAIELKNSGNVILARGTSNLYCLSYSR